MIDIATICIFTLIIITSLAIIDKIRMYRLKRKYNKEWFDSKEQDLNYLKRKEVVRNILKDLK